MKYIYEITSESKSAISDPLMPFASEEHAKHCAELKIDLLEWENAEIEIFPVS